ncbi:MAG: alpha-galactosidase [Lachnospiraceae bacterium]|nr:alpha-galactosidase [Lachnospiraceae bacterium]
MSIRYLEQTKTFMLDTKSTTYQMKVDHLGYLMHTYYGETISDDDLSYLYIPADRGFSGNPYEAETDRTYSLDTLPQEFSSNGVGDCRKTSIEVLNADGSVAFAGTYKAHNIYTGKNKLEGLPSTFPGSEEVETLEITLEDAITNLQVILSYSVFEDEDVITRSVKVVNASTSAVKLNKIMSATIDFLHSDFDFIHFDGRHVMERNLTRTPVAYGVNSIESVRGTSSHQHNPFAILCDPKADEDHGDCYGFAFVYSGNFLCEVEKDQFSKTRISMGINPRNFCYLLGAGEEFQAPEVVMSFSANGFAKLSHQYHDMFRGHLITSKFVDQPRPVVINSWEAAYFDFDEDKLLHIAESSVDMGVDMFVLDDGWFGKRDNDLSGLGDWFVNTKKVKSGISGFADKINALGLKFGLWVEPEMVSEDSDLYRAHPDWAIKIKGRRPTRARHQLLLDFSRKDVCDYIIDALNTIIDSANIDYIKWDFNRNLTDVWSHALPAEQQGEVFHRYVLGLYRVFDEVILTHPDIIFCGCSGGGGRFDAGILYYSPQIWTSDNTDAINRLSIQYGTSFAYPVNTMEAHVSVCPNHQTFRTTPIDTRGIVAMGGVLGYEFDSTKLTPAEKEVCKTQIGIYKKDYDVIGNGDYYRLTAPDDNNHFMGWQFVSKDGKKAIASVVITEYEPNGAQRFLRLKGLEADAIYYIEELERKVSGRVLMKAGIPLSLILFQYDAIQYHLEKM